MVDVADKSISAREAEAEGEISITSKILEAIKQQTLKTRGSVYRCKDCCNQCSKTNQHVYSSVPSNTFRFY